MLDQLALLLQQLGINLRQGDFPNAIVTQYGILVRVEFLVRRRRKQIIRPGQRLDVRIASPDKMRTDRRNASGGRQFEDAADDTHVANVLVRLTDSDGLSQLRRTA